MSGQDDDGTVFRPGICTIKLNDQPSDGFAIRPEQHGRIFANPSHSELTRSFLRRFATDFPAGQPIGQPGQTVDRTPAQVLRVDECGYGAGFSFLVFPA